MRDKYVYAPFAILCIVCMGIAAFYSGFLCGYGYGKKKAVKQIVTVRDTVTDTIPSILPVPVDSVQTGVIRVPVVMPSEPEIPKARIKVFRPDSLDAAIKGGTQNDSAEGAAIYLPRMQRHYKDTTYEAWISGYRPRLDSVKIFRKTITVTNTQTVTKRNRLGLGVIGGIGYGVISRKPDVWIGIGGAVRLW